MPGWLLGPARPPQLPLTRVTGVGGRQERLGVGGWGLGLDGLGGEAGAVEGLGVGGWGRGTLLRQNFKLI